MWILWCVMTLGAQGNTLVAAGRAQICDRQYELARASFQQALDQDGQNVEAMLGLISAMGYTRQLDQASKVIEQYLGSDSSASKVATGYMSVWKRDYGAAQSQLMPFVDDGKVGYLANYLLGYIKFLQKDNTGAVEFLKKSVAQNAVYPESYFVLGDTYRAMGDNKKVVEYWTKYLDMTPKGNNCQTYVSEYLRKLGG